MEYINDITKLFNQDIKDKRMAGRGAFKRKGKGVKHGMRGIRFPSDSLTAAQKRKLNGEVIVVSGLGVKLKMDEFLVKDLENRKKIMAHWRNLYSSKDIQEFLEIDKNVYYKLLYELEILEKPDSLKPKNGTRKRTDSLPDATTGDVMKYEVFKKLSAQEKWDYLENIYTKYNLKSVASIWNMTLTNFYNVKFQIKSKLERVQKKEENNLHITQSEKIQNDEGNNEQKVRQIDIWDEPHNNYQIPPDVHVPTDEYIPQEIPLEQAIVEPDVLSNVAMNELNIVKEMVNQQNQLIQEILSMTQRVTATTEVTNELPSSIPVTVVGKKSNNMEFSFIDEKEGFLLHQDIKRFIAVLEKNPDMFEVEIKIKRKE